MFQATIQILILLVLAYIATMLHFAIPAINQALGAIESRLSELADNTLLSDNQ